MWRKRAEIARLKALRTAAFDALGGELIASEKVELALQVHADVAAGDLDNFITGVCDGLMAAHRNTPIRDEEWSDVPADVHPRRAVAFEDDSCVCRIVAERIPCVGEPHYEVELSW